jgi:hypothetical protein
MESSSEKQTTCKILTATTEKDILIPYQLRKLKFQRILYFVSSKRYIKKKKDFQLPCS